MSEKKHTLSVILITLNEADRIRQCLESVKWVADEIIVFDSGSEDGTIAIVREFTDHVWQTDWPGFGVQKQRALEKASCEWVLSIDADEALDVEMQQAILALMSKDEIVEVAFKLPWGVTTFGVLLNHGRSARAPLRLVLRQGACFTPAQVHEKLLHAEGKIGRLPGRLLHFTHRDFGHYLQKNARYAWLGAQKRFENGKHGGGLWGAALRSIWTFIHIYIFRLGFLDGSVGFLVAVMYAQGSFNKYAGLWTLRRMQRLKNQGK
ncbi:MAG TPA: glycosyltransferase family 2 protein [Gammaproteobacteria bacterium]|nr:glycosyltransferase family 2 protein [Gammaproteobacteria bacterium]